MNLASPYTDYMVFVNNLLHSSHCGKRNIKLLQSYHARKIIITSKEIGGRIKKRRIELGISQEKLADVLGVTYQQVQRYENGANRLNVENIQLIADILSVPVSHFFASDEILMVAEEVTTYYLPMKVSSLDISEKSKIIVSKTLLCRLPDLQ